MDEDKRSTVFDADYYGVALRMARQKAGYNRAADFCDVVSTWTGVRINKEALYRIEKGVQPPTVEQLIAFGLILNHGMGSSIVVSKIELTRCFTPYAEFLSDAHGDLSGIMAYDGMYYDSDCIPKRAAYKEEEGAQFIDERFQGNLEQAPF